MGSLLVGDRAFRLMDTTKGIWNPTELQVTLSLTSMLGSPYEDEELDGGLLRYRYRKGSIEGDNTKMRAAAGSAVPLIYFREIVDGTYVPVFPVYVIADSPAERCITVALDESLRFIVDTSNPTDDQRRYAERIARVRLHQPVFRGRVMVAYRKQCSVCELKHPELLDAAHIVGDSESAGQPVVSNGLSLCKIHHAAYDQNLLGVDPNHTVHINAELLREVDGPMLKHGIQEMHGRLLQLPRRLQDRPDRERLEMRFAQFRATG
jgi:putative restriction endonuclease